MTTERTTQFERIMSALGILALSAPNPRAVRRIRVLIGQLDDARKLEDLDIKDDDTNVVMIGPNGRVGQ